MTAVNNDAISLASSYLGRALSRGSGVGHDEGKYQYEGR